MIWTGICNKAAPWFWEGFCELLQERKEAVSVPLPINLVNGLESLVKSQSMGLGCLRKTWWAPSRRTAHISWNPGSRGLFCIYIIGAAHGLTMFQKLVFFSNDVWPEYVVVGENHCGYVICKMITKAQTESWFNKVRLLKHRLIWRTSPEHQVLSWPKPGLHCTDWTAAGKKVLLHRQVNLAIDMHWLEKLGVHSSEEAAHDYDRMDADIIR